MIITLLKAIIMTTTIVTKRRVIRKITLVKAVIMTTTSIT